MVVLVVLAVLAVHCDWPILDGLEERLRLARATAGPGREWHDE